MAEVYMYVSSNLVREMRRSYVIITGVSTKKPYKRADFPVYIHLSTTHKIQW